MAVMRSPRTKTGFVYVVSATNGYVKIGKASNPYERFTMIQCSSPLLITLEYVCQCADPVDIEEAAHNSLDEFRRHREWFETYPEMAIAALRSALDAAGAALEPAPRRAGRYGAPPQTHAKICETAIPKTKINL